MSVPWGRTTWMLHHVNHGGALEVQYPLRSATKGVRAGLRVAAAMHVGRPKIRGVGVSTSHEAEVAHVHLGPVSLLPTKNALGQPP